VLFEMDHHGDCITEAASQTLSRPSM
jgi:hypothetical protein